MQTKYRSGLITVIGAVLMVVLGAIVLAFSGSPDAEARTEAQVNSNVSRTITVVGEGKVKTAPDIAQINIGIETVGTDVKQTSSEAADAMDALLAALKAQGIGDNDIQTAYYNVWVERPFNTDRQTVVEPIYHVNNNVTVTVRDLEKVATTLSAAIEAGANNVNSVNFNIADPEQLRSEARQKAVDDGLATARELADLNGVEVGDVISISEVIGSRPFFGGAEIALAQGVGGGGAGPISPGEVEVTVQLQVTYELK